MCFSILRQRCQFLDVLDKNRIKRTFWHFPLYLPSSAGRCVVYLRLFVHRLQFHDNRPQAIVAAADRHIGLIDPVTVIKQLLSAAMGQCKYILIDSFPGLIAESIGLCVISIKNLSLLGQAVKSLTPYSFASSASKVVFKIVIFTFFIFIYSFCALFPDFKRLCPLSFYGIIQAQSRNIKYAL